MMDCSWYRWVNESKIYLIGWIALVIIIMFEASDTWIAWLILHLIVNNSASVIVKLMVWWIVLAIMLWPEQPYDMDITTLFFILAFKIKITVLKSDRESSNILLSFWKWVSLTFLSLQQTV